MDCLVCGNQIVIHQFQQIFSLEEPRICSQCSSEMIEYHSSGFPIRLYEDNLFMREFVHRLKQGDYILYEVIIKRLKHVISKMEGDIGMICPTKTDDNSPYPPNDVLVEKLSQYPFKFRGHQTLFITHELVKGDENQVIISIL